MESDQWLVLFILAAAVILFIIDRIRVDIVALLTLVSLVLTGLLTPAQAFSGFASPAVVTVWAVFIISGALYHSGVADLLAEFILRRAGSSPRRLMLIIMVVVGFLSAFMNNIGAVAILMPAVIAICRQVKISPSKMLMPMAFAALLGGNMTLIGTPPNILAADILDRYSAIETFQFFDYFPVGIVSLVAGIIYMVFFGWKILPDREPMASHFPVREYVTEARVRDDSPWVDKSVVETEASDRFDINILQIRHKGQEIEPETNYRLCEGDVLLMEGHLNDIVEVSRRARLRLLQDWGHDDNEHPQNLALAEIALTPASRREGQTLKDMDFRNRYGLSVLAIRHKGREYTSYLGEVPLTLGDELLVQGPKDRILVLHENPNFLVLDTSPLDLKRTEKIPLVLGILVIVLSAITARWIDPATALLVGALAMVLTGVLTMEDAYRAIDWQAVFLIAGLLPLGAAMEATGTARFLAMEIILLLGGWGNLAVLGGLFILTSILTSFISNAATTVLMVPIAISAALSLEVDPRPLVMATVLAASTSFMTPVGHQVNVIILGPGDYRFGDYTRVGIGLTFMVFLVTIFFLPLVWPF